MNAVHQAFNELWWFYLCRVQEKHRAFDKMLATMRPEEALFPLEDELLVNHPVYHRSVWFLGATNVLIEAGVPVDVGDERILAVLHLVRELSRQAIRKRTWRNALVNGVFRFNQEFDLYRGPYVDSLIRLFSQYVSLTEEFHGSREGRSFYLWASKIPSKQELTITRNGHQAYLPSQHELESRPGIGLTIRIGSKLYLDLLEKAHDILRQARQRGPDSFSSAMWALQADSLFDPAKVAMAHSLRHATQPFLWDQSTEQSDETFQSVAPPTFDELRPYYEALAEQEALAGRVSSEEMWCGRLRREHLFDSARKEVHATEYA